MRRYYVHLQLVCTCTKFTISIVAKIRMRNLCVTYGVHARIYEGCQPPGTRHERVPAKILEVRLEPATL